MTGRYMLYGVVCSRNRDRQSIQVKLDDEALVRLPRIENVACEYASIYERK